MSAALGRLCDSISFVCRGERPSSFDAGLKVVTSAELSDFDWDIQTASNSVETYGTHSRSCNQPKRSIGCEEDVFSGDPERLSPTRFLNQIEITTSGAFQARALRC
jgi:hypothetical protein